MWFKKEKEKEKETEKEKSIMDLLDERLDKSNEEILYFGANSLKKYVDYLRNRLHHISVGDFLKSKNYISGTTCRIEYLDMIQGDEILSMDEVENKYGKLCKDYVKLNEEQISKIEYITYKEFEDTALIKFEGIDNKYDCEIIYKIYIIIKDFGAYIDFDKMYEINKKYNEKLEKLEKKKKESVIKLLNLK